MAKKSENGFIVYPSYKVDEGRAFVYLFGRLENGDSFLTINKYRPYFCIKTKDRKKAEKLLKLDYEDTDFVNFDADKVTKVIIDVPKDVPKIKKMFLEENIVCYEADIRFPYRFMIDKDIKGCVEISGEYEKGEFVDRVYKEPEIKPTAFAPKLKVLSFDIESDKSGRNLYSIALYSEKLKKCLIIKKGKYKNAESFSNEKELLERFKQLVIETDPDIITGWNVIDFDMVYLRDKFSQHKIKFELGRVDWPCKLRITESFFETSSADVPGRAVLDGIRLVKMSFLKLPDYKLNTAAKEFLGEEKIFKGDSRHEQIDEAYKKKPQLLIDYNIKDAQLAYDIIEKTNSLNLTIRRSMLTRMQPDRVDGSVASLDSLYLKEVQKRKIVAPTAFVGEGEERIKGGFVRESMPGIYDNIIVLDFKSLYPSIILTFNIDPYSFVGMRVKDFDKKKFVKTPNGAIFRNETGVLPDIIKSLWEQRDAAKKKKDMLESHAIKILMNSFFGVLANPACRFYSRDMANAITHSGQFLIQLCAKKVEEMGHTVIYGDTDSLFVDSHIKKYDDAVKKGEDIQKSINTFLQGYIKKEYARPSFMEIQFEKVYKKFLMTKVRHGEEGAKKRYAGLLVKGGKDVVDFVGLEFVRRDWTEVAKQFQLGLLDKIFHDKPVMEYVQQFVKDLQAGKYDDLLVYRKSIRKDVKEYTKTTPPHIKAARKAGITGTGVVAYYMTVKGPEIADERKSKIDYEHYIDKQIKPIADSVLVFYKKTFDDLMKGSKQKSLSSF
ncbi:MAG: DNA polymerase II [Nanoarchaeota archaeon]|nr:DNA polymerase II [Nanoarchaeota archaeon]